ncbi:hypothetical protein diail_1620 [Diaporthe ilicicola]|nr:hypothetical protein diail_1620 [Diaporthe ilicicola]
MSMWSRKTAAAVSSGEQVAIHKVRFQPRRDYFRHLDLKNLPEIDDEEEEDPFFIPFPFTDEKIQPPPYAGKEEEWQSFVAFNNDPEHRNRAKHDLAMLVKKTAEKSSQMESIEISDDAIAITTQKVDPRTKTLIDRVLKPYPLATSSYAFIKAFFKQSTSDVGKLLGFSENNDISTSSPDPDIAKTLKRLEAGQIADGGAAPGSSSASASTTSKTDPEVSASQRSSFPDAMPAQDPTAANGPHQPGKEQDKRPLVKEVIPAYPELVNKSQGPWAAFRQQWRRSWRPLKYYPPRGSVAIHGMVALESPRGDMYIDVTAWYHPKKREFHQESMLLALKAISPKKQSPRR